MHRQHAAHSKQAGPPFLTDNNADMKLTSTNKSLISQRRQGSCLKHCLIRVKGKTVCGCQAFEGAGPMQHGRGGHLADAQTVWCGPHNQAIPGLAEPIIFTNPIKQPISSPEQPIAAKTSRLGSSTSRKKDQSWIDQRVRVARQYTASPGSVCRER